MKEYVDALGEIYLERERYLLNIDGLLEEIHSKAKSEMTADNIKAKSGYNDWTVCCGIPVGTDEARGAEIEAGE